MTRIGSLCDVTQCADIVRVPPTPDSQPESSEHDSVVRACDLVPIEKHDRDQFRTAVANSELFRYARLTSASELFDQYHYVLQ